MTATAGLTSRGPSSGRLRGLVARPLTVQLVVFGALIGIWWLASRAAHPLILPSPLAVLGAWFQIVASGELPKALFLSFQALVLGLALALVLGISVGVTIGWFRRVGRIGDTILALLLVMPMVGLIPTLIVTLGLGLEVRVATVFLFAVPIIAMNSFAGTRSVDAKLVEMARSFGTGNRHMIGEVFVPAAMPGIAAGVRLGIGRAVVGMVTAELLIVSVGVGLLIQRYSSLYQTAALYATIITIIQLGVLMAQIGRWVERRVMRKQGRVAAFGNLGR
jgi:NitT/TauT family transport system permease protein